MPSSPNRCGPTWQAANATCGLFCAQNSECTNGAKCFSMLSLSACIQVNTTIPAEAPISGSSENSAGSQEAGDPLVASGQSVNPEVSAIGGVDARVGPSASTAGWAGAACLVVVAVVAVVAFLARRNKKSKKSVVEHAENLNEHFLPARS
ncbi:hypothetical protein CcCBS67573_g04187 [Chytriomyces confervae]|uniref:Uncharacterized protein n=1 Tax=Chytriomyces confervae TaxID=246404 RepID=A0A507FE93_9FUNG|nr:hypothetical protein CcCBS67573_g04187 [Chytriomyces confervae]